MDWIRLLFDTSDFPARWHCGRWSDLHGWIHVSADLATWAAYTAIPLVLAYFIRKRKDLPFTRLFWLFCVFIFACGTVHLIEAAIFWKPVYRLSALAKVTTAIASWATVAALIPLTPKALALPGLEQTNARLRSEIGERESAVAELRAVANELAASNQDLEQYARAASHDLKEPLRMVINFGDLLRETAKEKLTEKEARCLEFMIDGAARMDQQIEALLAYSRAARGDSIGTPGSPEEAVATALANLATLVEESEASVDVGPLPPLLPVELGALTSLFQNLIENALKYRVPGEPARIEIRAEQESEHTMITVTDEGVGIESAVLERVFDMFKRGPGSKGIPGSGMGLAHCRRVVTRAGGRVWAEPNPKGKGTVVRLKLPLGSTQAPPFGAEPKAST